MCFPKTINGLLLRSWLFLAVWAPGACTYAQSDAQTRDEKSEEHAIVAQGLEEQLQRWWNDTAVRCTFDYRKGVAESVEKGLAGTLEDKPQVRASGSYFKLGSLMRMNLRWGQPVTIERVKNPPPGISIAGDGDYARISQISVEEVTNGDVAIEYIPLQRGYGNRVGVNSLDPKWRRHAGRYTSEIPTPLSASGTSITQVLRTATRSPHESAGAKTARSVAGLDSDHVTVQLKQADDAGRASRELVFWVKPTPAVIVSDAIRLESATGLVSEIRTSFEGFRECQGGMVASIVRQVSHTTGEGYATVAEWTSRDLGKTPPTEDDFIVFVPTSAQIAGLRTVPAPSDGEIPLDIRRISPSDMTTSGVPAPDSRRLSLVRVVIAVSVSVGMIGLAFAWLRRRMAAP